MTILAVLGFGDIVVLGESISVTEAEARAILMAVQSTRFMGYENVIFESNCNSLVQSLNGNDHCFHIQNVLLDIRLWSSHFKGCHFLFVKRQEKEAAHFLARHSPQNNIFFSSCPFLPFWLAPILYKDYVTSSDY